jgi:hypothetical protein
MSNEQVRPEPPSEEVVLQRIAQWEAMREFWLQALRENPHLVAKLDERTRVNLGFN